MNFFKNRRINSKADYVIFYALLALAVLIALREFIRQVFFAGEDSIYAWIIPLCLTLLLALGIYLKSRVTEIFSMIFALSLVILSVEALFQFFSPDFVYSGLFLTELIFAIPLALLALTITVLLFKRRFNRSKEMTDSFVNY